MNLELPSINRRGGVQKRRRKLTHDVLKSKQYVEEFFVNKYKNIILKRSETFSNRYGMKDLGIALQLESVLSCTAEKTTISMG